MLEYKGKPGGNLMDKPENVKDLMEHPLKVLPTNCRSAVFKLWACHRHLHGLDSPLSIAVLFHTWIHDFGLKPEDVNSICTGLLSPQHVAQHRFASDLTSKIAYWADRYLQVRRNNQEKAARLNNSKQKG